MADLGQFCAAEAQILSLRVWLKANLASAQEKFQLQVTCTT